MRLPLLAILADTVLIPWRYPLQFFKPLMLPGLVLLLLIVGGDLTDDATPKEVDWVLYGLYAFGLAFYTVTIHRLVLLGPVEGVPKVRWSMRETRFLVWGFVLVAVYLLAILAVVMPVGTILINSLHFGALNGRQELSTRWLMYAATGVAMYCFARLSLVLPATAVDRKVNLNWAWRLSANNGWRLVIIVAALPKALSYAVGRIYREEAGTVEFTAIILLLLIAYTLGIVALSLSYHELASHEATHSKRLLNG